MAKSFCCVPGGGNLRHYCITQDFHLNRVKKSQNFSTSPEIFSPSIHLKSFPGSMVRKSYLSGAGKYFIGENQKTTNSIVMLECVCRNVFLCVYCMCAHVHLHTHLCLCSPPGWVLKAELTASPRLSLCAARCSTAGKRHRDIRVRGQRRGQKRMWETKLGERGKCEGHDKDEEEEKMRGEDERLLREKRYGGARGRRGEARIEDKQKKRTEKSRTFAHLNSQTTLTNLLIYSSAFNSFFFSYFH